MGKSKRSSLSNKKAFLAGLRDLVSTLPSESEKQEVRSTFSELIAFLTSLRQTFDTIPSAEEMDETSKAIQKLDELFIKAENNPVVAKALGMPSKPKARKPKSSIAEEDIAKAKNMIASLESLSIDEIRGQLQSEKYSLSELRAMAPAVGIRSSSKLSREALAHQITMKIANYRGYRHLSGQTETEEVADKATESVSTES